MALALALAALTLALALVLASLVCCLVWVSAGLVWVSVWVLGLVGSMSAVALERDLAVILVMLTLDFCDIDFLSLVTKKSDTRLVKIVARMAGVVKVSVV